MMALQSQECVKDSTKFEETELSRRESARIKDKRRAEKELQVRRRVELLNEQPVVAGDGGRRKRIKHCYSRRASVKNGHGEVEKISQGFEVGDKPMNRSLEAENMAVGENGAASTFEKSDYAKVKETLRVFNKHYLHFVQEEEKRCGKVKAEAEGKASKASKSKKRAAREEKKSKASRGSKSKAAPEDTKSRTKRPDLKAVSKMMETNGILYPEKRIGDIPGIKVGHQFYARAEMVVVGFHSHWLNGIDYMGQSYSKGEYRNYTFPLAVAIVLSGMYEDDLDNADDVVYTGQGGHDLTGKKHQIQDQKMERGNLALKNCVEQHVPVRVVRGHESKSSYTGKVYTYDGLYKVVKYWAEKGLSGFTVYKYRLRRLEGQPLLTTNQVHFTRGRVPQSVSEIRGLVCEDITGGQEDLPIPATNLVDDPPVAPTGYKYCKSVQVVKNVKLPNNASGCNCKGMCVDPKTCACAMLNGSDFPYVSRDGGRLIEAKDVVFECGPKCGCGPDCVNRTSQRGLKYRLEVFRTPKKGWAVRSWDFIPSGAPVCEYTGILMRTQDLDSVAENNYIFEIDCLQTMRGLGGRERRFRDVPVPTIISSDRPDDLRTEDVPVPTIISSDRPDDLRSENIPEFCIDAGSTGNIARFINHSCEPNLFVQCVLSSHHDIKLARVMLFAADNIPPLQELTYDYGYALDSVSGPDGKIQQMFCYCGAADCRKRLF
ncbi:histone-lysine N-methyltransferase, H3 lysine-9 specific SUVH4 isoform X2 [Alnus glutinosa]|uniref:histone-lysine N-methyltransferase, H3 lysine-9 specific SUVH4 isoform X2 n=1 Tax=Alnus glutinosa TaxID=3517 RepID=UPI002D771923|nr:histone-lysine N-methyltransferase, H3 lysine-9 specific SUVH4 isoform X2 [Alnus glutinosa]